MKVGYRREGDTVVFTAFPFGRRIVKAAELCDFLDGLSAQLKAQDIQSGSVSFQPMMGEEGRLVWNVYDGSSV